MANTARSAPSPSPSTSLEPSAHAAAVSVERLVLDICHRERRGMAMQILTKDDPEAMSCLGQLLYNIAAATFHAHQQGVDYIITNWQ